MDTQHPTDTDAALSEAGCNRPDRAEGTVSSETEAPREDHPEETAPAGPEEDEKSELASLREEVRMYKDRWVRLAAEFDNYKKRTNREFGTLVKHANESLITQLLPTLDNMNRALQTPRASGETESFARGFEMIVQQFQELLEKQGLQVIETGGEAFDPTKHEAVMAIERDDQPPDTVIEEVEKGYMLHDKVLRPSKVVVSRTPEPERAEKAEEK